MNTDSPRIRPVLYILGIDIAAVLAWQVVPNMSEQNRLVLTVFSQILTILSLLVWFVFFSRMSSGLRFRSGVVTLVLIATLALLVEFRDFSGNLLPVPSWRWTPKPDAILDSSLPVAGAIEAIQVTPYDYPRFLGTKGTPIIEGVTLATDWVDNPPKQRWRQKIGAGWSGFVVVADLAVTQEQRGEEELVSCYRLSTGQPLWAHADPHRYTSSLGGDGPRATPTIDGGMVYTVGATGLLNCLELATGKRIWSSDLVAEHQGRIPEWGYSCSPLVTERFVVVSIGGSKGRSLVAHDRESGEFVWGAGDDISSYASPFLYTLADEPQIIVLNYKTLVAHNPNDGQIIWQMPWGKGTPNAANPLPVSANRLLVSAGYGVGSKMYEIASQAGGGTLEARVVYETPRLKAKFSNYVLHEDHIFGLDDGILACMNVANGAKVWKQGRYGHGQLLLVDEHLLLLGEAGTLYLIPADSTGHRVLAEMEVLNGKSWNHMAMSRNLLLLRNHLEVVCLEMPIKP